MNADPLVGGIALYASSIKGWDGLEYIDMDVETKKEVIALIKDELRRYPSSELIE